MNDPDGPTVRVGDRAVGGDNPPYVIAEAGANHDGDLAQAKRLIDAAVEANADAIKFQNYTAEKLVTRSAKTASVAGRSRTRLTSVVSFRRIRPGSWLPGTYENGPNDSSGTSER